ncbi:hypothetical protein BJX63DRAFT_445525 [Aspergillus granulosus]|uniref:Uncharacterized protein n=1 Tax=Aspergillus granulosus TaxID=176169 RepID=A0ABR4H0U4_9EURO
MSKMDPLDHPLGGCSPGKWVTIIELLWGETPKGRLLNGESASELNHEAYFQYYHQQCSLMALHGGGQYVTVNTLSDVHHIVQMLKQHMSRHDIVAAIKGGHPVVHEEFCEYSVNFTVRLLLMLRFGHVKYEVLPRRCLTWTDGSLAEFVAAHFNAVPILSTERIRLQKSFDAWSLNAIAGITIEWTDNLADHLLLVDDDTKLLIFHHASFLEHQWNSVFFPQGLVAETLQTLALLFPQSEFSSPHSSKKGKHKRVIRCGNLRADARQIEKFRFWRDRLIVLKQTYDDATPSTISQWWHDRRNGVQWYTFWVAILILIISTTLGIVQCVEGALQVYLGYRQVG